MIYNIDNSHTLVEFSVRHMMVSNAKGRFGTVTGTFDFDESSVKNDGVDVTIDATSIDTRDEKRDGHLKSADFFDVENYPTLTFKSTKVEKIDSENYKVTGNLTIKGNTREVTLDVEYNGTGKNPWGMTVAGFTAKTSISRKEFDLSWNVALETGGVLVGDKVNIHLEVEGVAQPVAAAV